MKRERTYRERQQRARAAAWSRIARAAARGDAGALEVLGDILAQHFPDELVDSRWNADARDEYVVFNPVHAAWLVDQKRVEGESPFEWLPHMYLWPGPYVEYRSDAPIVHIPERRRKPHLTLARANAALHAAWQDERARRRAARRS